MTTEELYKRLKAIEECAGDDEKAHALEDKLRNDFIEYVASLHEGLPSLAAKAKLVLSTRNIEFNRWCA